MSLTRSILLSLVGLLSFSIFAKTQDILIKNATVITSTDLGVLEETDVLIQNGTISLVSNNIDIDTFGTGTTVIEANGRALTAGLLAPVTNLGLIEIESVSYTHLTLPTKA